MDMKSFARRKNNGRNEPVKEDINEKEQLEKKIEELSGKSESELMNNLFAEVQRGRQDGSFSEGALTEFMDKVSPMLTAEQKQRMREITSRLKM